MAKEMFRIHGNEVRVSRLRVPGRLEIVCPDATVTTVIEMDCEIPGSILASENKGTLVVNQSYSGKVPPNNHLTKLMVSRTGVRVVGPYEHIPE